MNPIAVSSHNRSPNRLPKRTSSRAFPIISIAAIVTLLAAASACGGRDRGEDDPAAFAARHSLDWRAVPDPIAIGQPAPVAPVKSARPESITTQFAVDRLAPTSGFPIDGVWLAASDGSFRTTVRLQGGPTRFVIRLKAVRTVGDWPLLDVFLDGRKIGSAQLSENGSDAETTEPFMSPRYRWIDVPFETQAAAGSAELRVEYRCSNFDPIERLGIRGILFDRVLVVENPPAENPSGENPPGKNPPATGAIDTGRKLLVIGLDGASWSVLLPMINHGALPNLASLLEQGSYGPLDSESPTISPAVWSSINTGQPRRVHGIDQMSAKLPDSYESSSHTTDALQSATIWQMAAAGEKSSLVVGMYATWPALPVKGVMVSDRSFHAPVDGGVWPARQESHVREALEELQARPSVVPDALPRQIREAAACDARVAFLTRAYLSNGQPDLTEVYLASTDHAGHLFWDRHAPFGLDHRSATTKPLRSDEPDPVEATYAFVDGLVGQLLASVDRERTTVIVVSDHSCDAADPVTPKRYRLADLIRVISNGKAYAPFDETWEISPVYLNVSGREPQGVVDPNDVSRVADEVRSAMIALTTDKGRKVFEAVEASPRPRVAPGRSQPADIVGIMNPNLDLKEEILLPGGGTMPVSKIAHFQAFRTGTHDRFGIVVLAGAGVRQGALIHRSTIFDIVPTELALLGLPRGADLPGRPLEEALADAVRSPGFLPSFDRYIRHAPKTGRGATLSPDETNRLKTLGYVQ